MTTATPAQTEQNQTAIQFNHRLETDDLTSILGITDTISTMVSRATGILYSLTFHFDGQGATPSDEIIEGALMAAIAEVKDIDSVINAHFDAVNNGDKA